MWKINANPKIGRSIGGHRPQGCGRHEGARRNCNRRRHPSPPHACRFLEKHFPETELLLFAASRAQLVREIIVPAVENGQVVLCDRFLDSTTVYQGVARQIADDPITQINSFAVGGVIPDLTVVLDVLPK